MTNTKPQKSSSNPEVWLDTQNIQGKRPSKKLDDTKVGPFDVIKKVGPLAYRLKLPRTWKIHPVFNVVYLFPYIKPFFPTQPQLTQPPPKDIKGQEEYIVEEVIDCCYNKSKQRPEWKVCWKGYLSSKDTMLVLGNTGEAVKEGPQEIVGLSGQTFRPVWLEFWPSPTRFFLTIQICYKKFWSW